MLVNHSLKVSDGAGVLKMMVLEMEDPWKNPELDVTSLITGERVGIAFLIWRSRREQ